MFVNSEILLVEDEPAIREGLAIQLESEGYVVRQAEDGERAMEQFRARRPGLVLLDVRMPRKNGFVVCAEMRAIDKEVPIIFLTNERGEASELRGLMLGADDYVVKSDSTAVLLARIAVAQNRAQRAAERLSDDFAFAGWRVDAARSVLTSPGGGDSVPLNSREVEMLRYFSLREGEVLGRDALLSRFWGKEYDGNDSALSTAISRLREKLGADGVCIEKVYGQGYRYAP